MTKRIKFSNFQKAVFAGLALIVLLSTVPAFLLESFCSKTELDSYPTSYHITEDSSPPAKAGGEKSISSTTSFSLGQWDFGELVRIASTKTTDYSVPSPYSFWRKFFCEINGADYTLAVFTTLLAIFTILLWLVTERTLRHAERSSERQLRAYLSLDLKIDPIVADSKVQIWAVVVNRGQTPAYKCCNWNSMKIFSVTENPALPFNTPTTPRATITINPSHDMKAPLQGITISAEQIASIQAEANRIYVWGELLYQDAFRKDRKVTFRAMIGKRDLLSQSVTYCVEGNEAD
jgi:hypothetical protein